jgi:hypothetical protein
MTPAEKAALGRALEALERPRAKDRQREAGPISGAKREGNDGSGKSSQPSRGATRDIVGEAVGMSGHTYERARDRATRSGRRRA